MMKQFKKLTLITTAAVLFCLTAVCNTGSLILIPSVTLEEQTDDKEHPDIQPMSDQTEEDEDKNVKSL